MLASGARKHAVNATLSVLARFKQRIFVVVPIIGNPDDVPLSGNAVYPDDFTRQDGERWSGCNVILASIKFTHKRKMVLI